MSGTVETGRPGVVSAGPMSGAEDAGQAPQHVQSTTESPKAQDPLAFALGYAAKGWPVFPVHTPTHGACDCKAGAACLHPGKHPWIADNLLAASLDAKQIRAWWQRWPDANVAIATGPAGLVVLDVDPRHGGAASLEELIAAHGLLPQTPQALTGGGGVHYLFANPNGHAVRSRSLGKLGYPGLDIKSDGGYIVATPSLHESGKRYAWEHSCHPQAVPLAPAPICLVALANGPATHTTAPENTGGTIPQGERNTVLTSLAGTMRRPGFSEAAILAALMETNRERCSPPLSDAEVATIAKNIGSKDPAPGAEAIPDCVTWEIMGEEIGAVVWDWDGWLPRALLTILAGGSGLGKSATALRVAGCYLCGWPWPDGTPFTGGLGAVLWVECEAAQAVNLDRARKWGLPLGKLRSLPLDVSLDNPEHLAAICREAARPDVRLVIVDSLRGAHRGQENDSMTMTVCKALAMLARDTGAPILLTHHLRKRGLLDVGEKVGLDRLRGSSAIVQTSRLVWAMDAPDPTHEEQRRLSVIKSNLAAFPEPLGLTIGPDGVAFGDAPCQPRQETQLDRAEAFLLTALKYSEQPQEKLQKDAAGLAISDSTLTRAKGKLRIVSLKKGSTWWWGLPIT
jgi:hypothetical protein